MPSHPGLRVAAARNVLGLLPAEQAVQMAHDLLDAGIYSPSLGKLIFLRFPYPMKPDVEQMFGAALKELGIGIPAPKEAAKIFLEPHLLAIAEEASRPLDQLQHFRCDLAGPFWDEPNRKIIAEYGECGKIINWCYWYDDYEGLANDGYLQEKQLSQMDKKLVAFANQWVRIHCRCRIDPQWLAWSNETVSKVAQAIDADRAFDRLPILADALEEAGCTDADILQHCRGPGPHMRGCWVIDLLLGKE